MSHSYSATDCPVLHLNKMPSTLSLYRRAILPKKHVAKSADQIPHLTVEITNQAFDAKKIKDYADVCGFRFNHDTLPVSYPHVLAFSLHLELMVSPEFPLPLLGLVHVRNQIRSTRSIQLSERVDIHVSLTEARDTDKGIEFDLTTTVLSEGQTIWESISTNLYRVASNKQSSRKAPPELANFRFLEEWAVKENTGRCYAKASGDSNPIHIHKWSARTFGFKQAIAHGMWTKARTLASLQRRLKTDALFIETEFKQPIFLPSTVALHYDETSEGMTFEIRNEANNRVHMKGSVCKL